MSATLQANARRSAWACVLVTATLGGCASLSTDFSTDLSTDAGFADVQKTTTDKLGKELRWSRTEADQDSIEQRVQALLAQPLTVDDAVQVALLNNRGLQASFQELGIGDADRVQASRLPNPGFSVGRLRRGDELEIERGLHVSGQMEKRRFEHTKGMVVLSVLSLAADTRKAYYQAVAAQESMRYMRQVKAAADASAELARRMQAVGNFNTLQRAREQVFQAEAALSLARAEQAQRSTRERLTRLLGAWGAQTSFTLPDRLPELPQDVLDLPNIEQQALTQRLDVQAAKQAAEHTARQLGLRQTTRFINVLELGVVRNSSNEAPTQRGWEISVELPLFDWGDARVARAEAVYMQAVHRAAEAAVNARSDVREAYLGYRSAYDIARFQRDEVVPLGQRIAEENQLRYNGMLIGVFELMADARAQVAGVNASIQALRDFWIAQADLDMALIGKPNLASTMGLAEMTSPTTSNSGGH
jgi:outer membrane protein TolC